jgi:hypothetical protein
MINVGEGRSQPAGARSQFDPTATLASPPSLLSTKCRSKINPIHMAKERILLTCMGFRITVVIGAALGFFPQGAANATANTDVNPRG